MALLLRGLGVGGALRWLQGRPDTAANPPHSVQDILPPPHTSCTCPQASQDPTSLLLMGPQANSPQLPGPGHASRSPPGGGPEEGGVASLSEFTSQAPWDLQASQDQAGGGGRPWVEVRVPVLTGGRTRRGTPRSQVWRVGLNKREGRWWRRQLRSGPEVWAQLGWAFLPGHREPLGSLSVGHAQVCLMPEGHEALVRPQEEQGSE